MLGACGLDAYRIDRKGDLGLLKNRGPHEKSSVHIEVSSAGFDDLPGQVADAMTFLRANESGIRAAVAFPGVEWAQLDFGVDQAGVAIDSKYLKPELLALAGGMGLGIALSIYPATTSSDAGVQPGVGPTTSAPRSKP